MNFISDWSKTGYLSNNSTILTGDDVTLVLPLVMAHLCPKVVALFGLGSVASAVMSSVDSAVLASSGMFSRNVYRTIISKGASEKELIYVLRSATVVFGIVTTLLTVYVRSIYALWAFCTDLVYVILFPQLTCALYFPSSNVYGSLSAFIVGVFFKIVGGEQTLGVTPIINYPWYSITGEGEITQMFPFKTFSMLMSLLSLLVISALSDWLFENGILSQNFDILRKSKTILKKAENRNFEREMLLNTMTTKPDENINMPGETKC
ncbi:SLC5A7 [Mytilus coruscus]|uniref:SLC5A7 n=1 Tax=Mytilus coruscus TaxID=42192 RepID=A0A6J8BA68_MYTCO|nr:SLC5A7 [Mytilus coruscus]